MTNTRNDLRQGTLWKQILFFSLPIAATSMLQQLFNSADVAVVGRFSAQKDLALAAVGSTSSVVNLFITIITGLAVGANVVIARSIGASDEKRAKQAVHTALILSLLCGAILLVLGECIALPLLEIMDTPSDIIGLAGKYLRIYMLGVFFQTIYNFEASILRANGDTRRPLFCLIFSGAVNVVLNLVFVIGFQLDVAGVAIATVLADVVGAGMLFHYLRRETGPVRVELSQLKLDRKLAGAILYTGIPAAVQGMMFNIANVIIQTGFNRLGSQVVAASTIGVTAEIFVYYLVNSFGQHDLYRTELRGGQSHPLPPGDKVVSAAGCWSGRGVFPPSRGLRPGLCGPVYDGRGHCAPGPDPDEMDPALRGIQYHHRDPLRDFAGPGLFPGPNDPLRGLYLRPAYFVDQVDFPSVPDVFGALAGLPGQLDRRLGGAGRGLCGRKEKSLAGEGGFGTVTQQKTRGQPSVLSSRFGVFCVRRAFPRPEP